ncbi:MAG TPA: hypothetical protein VLG76_00010 [Rhabdochlamydiaceae bacterium]|nr:hypothetical protein [Rhabdochlamydiaceae bacterium]
MNFTREPIIETIVTPMEGYKLIVRSSKGTAQEEFVVDAVEVVSFGHSFFFRSLEKPKAFLVPISDYEILEVKETRVVLKSVGVERAIKIGGGRDALKAREPQESGQPSEERSAEEAPAQEPRSDKKRDRGRRHRRRRHEGREMREESSERQKGETKQAESTGEVMGEPTEAPQPASFSRLFPPPPTLISEKLAKIKKENPEFFEKEALEPQEKPIIEAETEKNEEGTAGSEPGDVSRLSSETTPTIQRTSFLSLDSWFKR